jgi:hypothetical protein
MEPNRVRPNIEEKLQRSERQQTQDGINWKEIRRKHDQAIGFGDNNMPAFVCDLELFDLAAKNPSPDRMS